MSADLLRRAAAVLRERAASAAQGKWGTFGMTVLASSDGTMNADTASPIAQGLTVDDNGRPRTWDIDYIATMHPGVGLALADWLDWTLTYIYGTDPIPDEHPALTVARAVFGETT